MYGSTLVPDRKSENINKIPIYFLRMGRMKREREMDKDTMDMRSN